MTTMGVVNQFGRLMVTPGVSAHIEAVNTSPPKGRHFREVVIIGPSRKGDCFYGANPSTITRTSDIETLKRLIGNGDVPTSVTDGELRIDPVRIADIMQHPSKDPSVHGAYYINFIRVGAPTRARWIIQDGGSDNVLDIYSADYGTDANEIRPKFERGAVATEGTTVTIKDNNITNTYSNLGRALRVVYTGTGTAATMTISMTTDSTHPMGEKASTLTTTVDAAQDLNYNLDDYPTIASLASAINANADYSCVVDANADPKMPPAYMDPQSAKDIKRATGTVQTTGVNALTTTGSFGAVNSKVGYWYYPDTAVSNQTILRVVSNTATTLTFEGLYDVTTLTSAGKTYRLEYFGADAPLGAIVHKLNRNESSRITVTKFSTAVGSDYDVVDEIDYMPPSTPGTYPKITMQDWSDALTLANRLWQKNGIIFPVTESAAVWQLFDAFCVDRLANDARWVENFCGGALDLTVDQHIENAKDLNSIHTTYGDNGLERYNENGEAEVFSPMHYAAAVAGMHAGSGLYNPTTGNLINCIGLENRRTKDDLDRLIENGSTSSFVDEDSTDGVTGYRVAFGLTTYTGDDNRIWRVRYCTNAVHTINQEIKRRCWGLFYGKRITNDVSTSIKNMAYVVLSEFAQPGRDQLLRSDPFDPVNKPAFEPPTFTFSNGVGLITWKGYLVDEGDWLLIDGIVELQSITEV